MLRRRDRQDETTRRLVALHPPLEPVEIFLAIRGILEVDDLAQAQQRHVANLFRQALDARGEMPPAVDQLGRSGRTLAGKVSAAPHLAAAIFSP